MMKSNEKLDVIEFNKQAWNSIVAEFARYRDHLTVTNLFRTFCALINSGTVLDLGCGTGLPFTKYLVAQNFNVTAIDIAENMLIKAQENVPDATFRLLSITDLDYFTEFAGVSAVYSMQLLDPQNFANAIQKIAYALHSKGFFYLALNEPINKKTTEIQEYLNQSMYFRLYSFKEIATILNKNNLQIIEVNRQIEYSDAFGEEHMLELICQKQ